MPLDLNRYDMGAMAAAAGNNVGNLNLPVADLGAYGRQYVEAMMARKQLEEQYAQMASQEGISQMNNQGAMDRQLLSGQQQMEQDQANNLFTGGQNDLTRAQDMQKAQMQQAMEQQRLAQQGQYQQGQLDQGQQQLGLDTNRLNADIDYKNKSLALEQEDRQHQWMVNEVKSMAEMKKEERNQIGAFGATISLLAKNSPQSIPVALQYGVQSGLIPEDMAAQLSKLSPDQLQAAGATYASLSDHADDYAKQLYGDKKGSQGGDGLVVEYGADGSRKITIGAENKVQAQAQQYVADTMKNLDSLESIVKDYDKDFLTYKGQASSVAGNILSKINTSDSTDTTIKKVTGGNIDPARLKQFTQKYNQFTGQVASLKMNMIKALSGLSYTDAQMKAMEDAIVSEKDSPDSFVGKAKGLVALMKTTLKTQQEVAAGGIPANSPEFQQAFDDRLQNNVVKELQAKNITGFVIDGKWQSADKIEAYAKHRGVSVQDVLQAKGVLQ